jgi:hypothetical protein
LKWRLSTEPSGFTVFEPQLRYQPAAAAAPAGAAVGLDVPFSKLMAFFVKAVFAAIPALIILTALLWISAVGLQVLFPDLVKLKVLVYMPKCGRVGRRCFRPPCLAHPSVILAVSPRLSG